MTLASVWSAWWPPSASHRSTWTGLTNTWRHRVRKAARHTGKSIVVFTDPEGTLLGHRTHPCVPGCEALRLLAEHDVPVVLCSSRTRAELELIQQEFRFRHPFISENGGAVYLPRGYCSSSNEPAERSGHDVIAFGGPHRHVVETLRRTTETLGIAVCAFHSMSVQEVANECGLSLAGARLAQLREYGEPFRMLASDPALHSRLLNALRRAGLQCVNSGRFHHASSGADVRGCVRALTSLYRQRFGNVLTVGVSAGLGDPSLLRAVDLPIVVPHPDVDAARLLRTVPTARVTSTAGSSGWDEAILSTLQHVPGPSSVRRGVAGKYRQ